MQLAAAAVTVRAPYLALGCPLILVSIPSNPPTGHSAGRGEWGGGEGKANDAG